MTVLRYKVLTVLFVVLLLLGRPLVGSAQVWMERDTIPMQPSDGLFSFAIGAKVFVGGGNHRDFFAYDTLTHSFERKADIPGVTTARSFPTSFSIGGKGYLAFGFDGSVKPPFIKNDLWEYDPASNKWTQKASCPGVPRDGAGAFVLNDRAYIGGGQDQNQHGLQDFYEYDPATDTWTAKANLGGGTIVFPATFAIGSYGYFATGGIGLNETGRVYRYDPATDTWTKRASFGGKARQTAVGFTLGGLGYVGLGQSAYTTAFADFYSYDPKKDKWSLVTSIPDAGGPRAWATATVAGNSVYMGAGWDLASKMLNDWWQLSLPITPYTPTPHLAFGLEFVDCGSITAHSSFDTTVNLYSGTETAVTISNVAFSGSATFTIKNAPKLPLTLNAGQIYPLTIEFAPTSDSLYDATLTVTSNAEGESSHQSTLEFGGQGVKGVTSHLTLTSASLNFNQIATGAHAVLIDTLKAGASADLHISAVSVAGSGSAAFTTNAPSVPYTLMAGSSLPLQITFAPSTAGTFDATLTITSDAEGETAHMTTVALRGIASSAGVGALRHEDPELSILTTPNPCINQVTLCYNLEVDATHYLDVQIVDEAGRMVQDFGTTAFEPGDHQLRLDTRSLAAGNFRVILQRDGKVVSIPIVKE